MSERAGAAERERRFLVALEQVLEGVERARDATTSEWKGRAPDALEARLLDDAAGDDSELRGRLVRALAIRARNEELEPPQLSADSLELFAGGDRHLSPGTRIGSYRIVGLLGEGGMGTVYEAEQERPRRRVALKLLPPGRSSESVLRRFRYETEALAQLQHPGIAAIYAADVAQLPNGESPFFAMELVRGEHLDEAASRLDRRERLRLFVRIADAVEHAHKRGIVHRDLKPANILVGDDGWPKILDFGVARALDVEGNETLHGLDDAQVLGTLATMSPEQARGDVEHVDARSDVYSLGVLLYQLLSGELPIELPKTIGLAALRLVAEAEPRRLGSVDPTLSGDLDWITAKAMAKERERRYASAAELAEDVERHLADETVHARPPTAVYQLAKLARRHRGSVTGALIALAVTALAAAATWRAWSAESQQRVLATASDRERDAALERVGEALRAAEDEAARARSLADFASEMLRAGNPTEGGRELSMAELLAREEARVAAEFAEQPELRAELQLSIGVVRRARGELDAAAELLGAALEARRAALGPDAPETAEAREELGLLELERGDLAAAEHHLRGSLDVHERQLGGEHRATLRSRGNLARVLLERGRLDEAELLIRPTLETQQRVLGDPDADVAVSLDLLGELAYLRGAQDEALACFRDGLALCEELYGPEHPRALLARGNLAVALQAAGELGAAEALTRELIAEQRRAFGPESREALLTEANLAVLLLDQERHAEAEALLRTVYAWLGEQLGATHPDALRARHSLGSALLFQRRLDEARSEFEAALELQRATLGAGHADTRRTLSDLTWTLHALGLREAALEQLDALARAHWEAGDEAAALEAEARWADWEAEGDVY